MKVWKGKGGWGVYGRARRSLGINAVSNRSFTSSLVVGSHKMIGLIVLTLLGAAGKAHLQYLQRF